MKCLLRYLGKGLLLLTLFLLFSGVNAQAKYELNSTQITPNIQTDGTAVALSENGTVKIEWEKMTADNGTDDVINGFVFAWNQSGDNATNLKFETVTGDNDRGADNGTITTAPFFVKKSRDFFANDDSNVFRYLHLKTWYNTPFEYSSDFVIGPINIDNVAPTGNVSIVNDQGQEITSTTSTNVDLNINAGLDAEKMYISEDQTPPNSPVDYATNYTYSFNNDNTGTKNVYVWFQDKVGNISDTPAQDSVEYVSTRIKPNSGSFDLNQGTQIFSVEGTDDAYDWEIFNATAETPNATVASFNGNATVNGTNSVNATLENPGTFQLKATSSGDGTTLESGLFSVVKSGFTITHSYNAGLNLVPFTLTGTGLQAASDLDQAIVAVNSGVFVSQIFGWDAQNQRFSSPYANFGGFSTGDFALESGQAYFVEVDGASSLTMQGDDYTSLNLCAGLNLFAVPMDTKNALPDASDLDAEIVNATGATVSQIFGWDAQKQRFSSPYANFGGFSTGDFSLSIEDQGYFIELSTNATYQP